ncbi:MAG: hypothetical protein PHP42_11790 [Bacteroidota bacterium]|nr:hypothetical protein [Bacteroidota bacterium]
MDKIKKIIDFHLSEVKTVSDVAALLNVPLETLRKKFFREEKIHLCDYVIQRKVQLMRECLIIDDEPCYLICYTVGLREDTGAKIFKKNTGMTMQEFREKYKKDYELLKNNPSQKQRLCMILAEAFCLEQNLAKMSEDSIKQDSSIQHDICSPTIKNS